ncbi:MAG TPA: hypothetical protein VH595_01260 [Verrucomicrobiae bacterium]|nr:hypothetical protein [Verrucomicrobiae bacterium]
MMKINKTKTNRRAAGPATSEAQRIARPGAATAKANANSNLRPFSDDLLEEAEQEPNHLDLDEYWQVIAKLREKGLTFREVAEWLAERNVHADHNAIYRVYTKHLSPDQAEAEERQLNGERLIKEI